MGEGGFSPGAPQPSPRRLRFGAFVLDLDRASVSKGEEERKLRPKSFEVLCYLAERPRRLLSKQELISAIWPDSFVTDNALVQCLQDVRRALDDESQELIRTVARRGYIFEAEVLPAASTDRAPDEFQSTKEQAHSHKTKAPVSKRTVGAILAVVILGLAAGIYRLAHSSDAGGIDSLAVLPFQSIGRGGGDEFLELGIADTLITKLSTLKGLTVRSTVSIREFARGADPLEAGGKLHVGAVVSGTVQRNGDRVRVSVRLLRVRDGRTVWADTFDDRFNDTFALEDAVSVRIARALSISLTGEDAGRLRRHDTTNTKAYEFYIRGRYFWEQRSPESLHKAISYFEGALQADPRYANAYAGIANCYGPMLQMHFIRPVDGLAKMVAAAVKAVELDPDLPDAHTALAATRFNEWNFPEAESESRRAIELNPGDPLPHKWYGYYLGAAGRSRESLAEYERANELDPLGHGTSAAFAGALADAGRQAEAIDFLKKTIEMNPSFAVAHHTLGEVYSAARHYTEALAEYRLAGSQIAIARVQAVSGQASLARQTLDNYLRSRPANLPVAGMDIAAVYTALNDRKSAFDWLERSYNEHDPTLIFLSVDHRFATLQTDPSFTKLVSRVHP
jgi:DNA-binding winged helix-turn-helix (wHTH) protein/TolB-like protein/Flp pilus assembly protein TadD